MNRGARQPPPLEERFHAFMRAIGALSIDDLTRGTAIDGEKKADYLSADKRVVIEVKTLKTDSSPKVDREIDKHRDREDFPVIYGDVPVDKLLRHLPDGKQINARIFRNVTRSVEDALLSAEHQISSTRRILKLDDGPGILVLLNEGVDILDPHIVTYKLTELFNKHRRREGRVDYVWMLFESHVTAVDKAHPCVVLDGPTAGHHAWFDPHIDNLQKSWARFNNAPLVRSNVARIVDLPFESARPPEDPVLMKRYERWQRAYRARPYLRHLSDEALLERGARVFEALAPHFLKGGPRVPTKQLEPKMVAWSDFLTESGHRGLDLRRMKPDLKQFGGGTSGSEAGH